MTDTDIKAGYRTDHSMITLRMAFGKETEHKLLWKFNNSSFKDILYADEISGS